MMHVWMITAGEYSDYGLVALFAKEEDAWAYHDASMDRVHEPEKVNVIEDIGED
jgi:hypothetical protein